MEHRGTEPAPTAPIELSLSVGGMTCATCAGRVERFLRRVPGVSEARVDLVGERAFVLIDPLAGGRDELAAAIRAAGYEPRAELAAPSERPETERDADERRLLGEALFALAVGFGAMLLMLSGSMSPALERFLLLPAALVQFVSGRRIYAAALRAARARSASMETLIAIGTSAAFASGLIGSIAPSFAHSLGLHGGYLEIAPIVIGFVLLGRFIERRSIRRANGALRALASLQPPLARLVRDGREETLPIGEIVPGDLIRLTAGERVPVDGIIVEGRASVDESAMSGESFPHSRTVGERLLGGSAIASGSLTLRASATGATSMIGRLIALVERAQSTKAPIARLADSIAARFVPAVLLLTLVTIGGWLLLGPEPRLAGALSHAIAILVVACPCALGLATPVALAVGLGRGAEAGLLVRDASVLESTSRLRSLVFDKTGTLTIGRPDLVALHRFAGEEEELLALAAGLEIGDEHPIGGAILRQSGARGVAPLAIESIERHPGRGVSGKVGERRVAIGSPRFARERSIELALVESQIEEIERRGSTPVLLFDAERLLALFEIADTLRPEAREALDRLRADGIDCWIASGDSRASVERIGGELGFAPSRIRAELLPEEKETLIETLALEGPVGMVGDGVNDGPALARADLGIAIGSGSSLARDAASLTIVRSDLRLIGAAVGLARATLRLIRGNLAWAFVYNLALIPLAAGIAEPLVGLSLSPALASLAMALSSIAVVLNSLRLRRTPLRT